MRKLLIEVARILNESALYKCGFTVVGETIYAISSERVGGQCYFWEIDPALYLEDVKGA